MSANSIPTHLEGLRGWQYWLLILLSGIALILIVFNMLFAKMNHSIQDQVASNQQYINQTIRISRLNSELIQALANLSTQTGDESIRKLLAAQGISFSQQAKP